MFGRRYLRALRYLRKWRYPHIKLTQNHDCFHALSHLLRK